MRILAIASLLLLAVPQAALATWSIIAIDIRTGQVIIASATCVRQMSFSQRQPNGARDLMDVQMVLRVRRFRGRPAERTQAQASTPAT